MNHIKRGSHHLSEWSEHRNRALAFGNIDTNCVHKISLLFGFVIGNHAFSHSLFNLLGDTNAPIWRLNLQKRTLQ